jgi:phosphatidylethanolamine/phosphatidyl-N-methylethanolamine N-methyltransferase
VSLKRSYSLIAPFYDLVLSGALAGVRRRALARLPTQTAQRILINGIGTGLDLPWLPQVHHYVGLDLTRAMLLRARPRDGRLDLALVQGDSLALPFADASFDHAVLHLILAIVPDPARALAETARILKPGGRVYVMDKFLRRGQWAPMRRALSPLAARIVTKLNVVFEDIAEATPALSVMRDEPLLAGGWFRGIELVKRA